MHLGVVCAVVRSRAVGLIDNGVIVLGAFEDHSRKKLAIAFAVTLGVSLLKYSVTVRVVPPSMALQRRSLWSCCCHSVLFWIVLPW